MAHKWLTPREWLTSLSFYACFQFSNRQLEIYSTRTISDNAGQIRPAVAARPNIAYLVATFGRDYSRNR